jgi:hypothetical protein
VVWARRAGGLGPGLARESADADGLSCESICRPGTSSPASAAAFDSSRGQHDLFTAANQMPRQRAADVPDAEDCSSHWLPRHALKVAAATARLIDG